MLVSLAGENNTLEDTPGRITGKYAGDPTGKESGDHRNGSVFIVEVGVRFRPARFYSALCVHQLSA